MNVVKGNEILLGLAEEYLSNKAIIDEIKAIILSPPPRVAVRGIFEMINKNKNKPFTHEDKDKFDDLFYFFG